MPTSVDYIPNSDTEFSAWVKNFLDYLGANLTKLGLVAADLTPLETALTTWDTTYSANIAAQAAAQGTRQTKDAARNDLEALVRTLAKRLQASVAVLDADRQSLGLNVRSTTRTAAAAPTSRPVATVDTRQRLQHTVSFVDELTPTSRAKPNGVAGCEIWVKIGGAAPVDPSELHYLAMDTRTPYTATFEGTDGGKMAYYMLRWVNTRSERGPWSQTVGATITG